MCKLLWVVGYNEQKRGLVYIEKNCAMGLKSQSQPT
jgi:hypothetical protein